MQVLNRRLRKICRFDEYLQLPGYSYSAIRSQGKAFTAPTVKMELGTKVHTYLLTPSEYKYGEDHELVRVLAVALKNKICSLIDFLLPECAVQADFIEEDLMMPWKGRPDLCIPDRLVI